MTELLESAMENTAAYIAFALLVLSFFGAVIVMVMFFLLAVRGLFHAIRRQLARRSWGGVIRGLERRALRP